MKSTDIAAMVSVNKSVYRPGPSPTGISGVAGEVAVFGVSAEVAHKEKQARLDSAPAVYTSSVTVCEPLELQDSEIIQSMGSPTEFTDLESAFVSAFPHAQHAVLYTFFPEQTMAALNVHTLDERLKFTGSSSGSFHIDWKSEVRIEILDLSAFFPHIEFLEVLEKFHVKRSTVARETLELATAFRAMILEDFGLDIVRYRTPGMLAARIFTGRYLKAPVGIVRKAIRQQGMLSYWAGNNQAFGRGEFEGDLRMYDAVSMYPSSCIQLGVLPCADDWYRMIESDILTCRGGVLRVEFEFPDDEMYPCLPVPLLDSLVFPLSGTSDCTVWEVRHALELGCKIRFLSGWAYTTGASDLADYSRRTLALKNTAELNGDTPRREMYKLLANSIFGKLAQKRLEESLEDKRTIAAALGYKSIAEMMSTDNWQYQAEQMLGNPVPLRATVGGLWCPEWAALVNGYARAVESRAMRDNNALLGTTDNVVCQALPGDPEEFSIMGIRYALKKRIAVIKIIRSRLYVYVTEDGKLDGALHGFPASRAMLEAVFEWDGADFYRTYRVPAVTKLRQGLISGDGAGKPYIKKWRVSFDRDMKRLPAGNFSMPHPFVNQLL